MNMPYQQPIMNNPYMQPQNPYIDRMNFLQSYQQSLQQPMAGTQMSLANQQAMPQQLTGINGRIVQAVENVNANEVPMDGSKAFFPKQDLSEIYVKGWNADGTINTITYKPFKDDFSKQTGKTTSNTEKEALELSDEATDLFQENFEKLFEKIEKLEERIDKNIGSQKKTTRTQIKEGE